MLSIHFANIFLLNIVSLLFLCLVHHLKSDDINHVRDFWKTKTYLPHDRKVANVRLIIKDKMEIIFSLYKNL